MIRVFIGDKNYTDYVTTGLSFIERLDEQLDEGSIKLFATKKETPFTPMTSVGIYGELSIIKAFLIAEDNVTVVSKNPVRYNHEITLIEVTKKLERFMVDGKTFTQPINDDSGYDPYTLYDVVKILRDTTPLRAVSEFDSNDEPEDKLIFRIPFDTQEVLDEVEAPEMNFKEQTLRECLDEVASYIDANVYLDEGENLRLNFFNERKTEIDQDFIERTLNRDVEYYSTNMETNVMNAVSNASRGDVNIETTPGIGIYTTSRVEGTVWDYTNSFFRTQNPIYDVKRVEIPLQVEFFREDLEDGEWLSAGTDTPVEIMEITNEILERKKAETLPVADGKAELRDNPDTLYANAALLYDYGKRNLYLPKIETFFTEYNALDHIVYRGFRRLFLNEEFDYTSDLEDADYEYDEDSTTYYIYFNFDSETGDPESRYTVSVERPDSGDVNNNRIMANVEYIAIKPTVRTNVEVSGVSDTPYKSVLTGNQQMRIVDVPKFADKTQALVDRLGLSDLIMVDRIKDFGDALGLGDITTDGFILTQREFIIFKDFVRVMYQFNKDFNKRNQYAGIDSEIRQWEIGEAGRTVERNAIFDEYIELTGREQSEQVSGDNSSKTLKNNSIGKILTTFEIDPTSAINYKPLRQALIKAQQDITVEDDTYTTPWLFTSFTPYAGGNQINLHFNIDDNGDAGYHMQRVVRWSGDEYFSDDWFFNNTVARFEQMPSLYVDEDGRIENFEFAFSDYDPKEDGSLLDYDEHQEQGDATPVAIPFETEDGVENIDAFLQVEGNIRLFKDNREKTALSLIYHFVSRDKDVMVGHALPRRNKLISLANNDDLRVFFFDRKLSTRHKRKLPTDSLSDAEADITIEYDDYYIDVNNSIPSDAESYAIASEDGLPFVLVNDTSKDRIVFDFKRNRTGVTYDYLDIPDYSISGDDSTTLSYTISVDSTEEVIDDISETIDTDDDYTVASEWIGSGNDETDATYTVTVETEEETVVLTEQVSTDNDHTPSFRWFGEGNDDAVASYNTDIATEVRNVTLSYTVGTASEESTDQSYHITVTENDEEEATYSISVDSTEETVSIDRNINTDEDYTYSVVDEEVYANEWDYIGTSGDEDDSVSAGSEESCRSSSEIKTWLENNEPASDYLVGYIIKVNHTYYVDQDNFGSCTSYYYEAIE